MGNESFRGGSRAFSAIKDKIAQVVNAPNESAHIVAEHKHIHPETARKWGNRFASATIVSFLASVPAEEMVSRNAAYLSLGAGWYFTAFAVGAFIEAGNSQTESNLSVSDGVHSSPIERV